MSYKLIVVGDMPIFFERRKKRSITLTIKPPITNVICTAPLNCSLEQVNQFILSKRKWIQKSIDYINNNKEKFSNREIDVSNVTKDEKIELNNKLLYYVKEWEQKTHLKVNSFSIRNMKTRWGSCTCKKANIRFALQLYKMPNEFIEYIVLHEICHIKHYNHSTKFYKMVEEYMPDWKERQKLKPIEKVNV
ncbi:MAG: DUF45 domain-containing protein [Eubacteriales bacterium]|nr:DUF45 domain-containing protein [Eubacteriales bacterium]